MSMGGVWDRLLRLHSLYSPEPAAKLGHFAKGIIGIMYSTAHAILFLRKKDKIFHDILSFPNGIFKLLKTTIFLTQ
jgi:hypothetical protein